MYALTRLLLGQGADNSQLIACIVTHVELSIAKFEQFLSLYLLPVVS